MIDLIISHPHSFWLTLGGLLLVAEMLGGAGYLLWSGVAAVLTGLISWIISIDWAWQGSLFAIITVISAWLWWLWLRWRQTDGVPLLNQRKQQLIGQRFRLEQALINGRGHQRIADGSWPVQASTDLAAGTEVQITAINGITLQIQPCANKPQPG